MRSYPATVSAIPQDLATIHAVISAITVIGWWLESGCAGDRDEVAALLHRLALAPVVAEG